MLPREPSRSPLLLFCSTLLALSLVLNLVRLFYSGPSPPLLLMGSGDVPDTNARPDRLTTNLLRPITVSEIRIAVGYADAAFYLLHLCAF